MTRLFLRAGHGIGPTLFLWLSLVLCLSLGALIEPQAAYADQTRALRAAPPLTPADQARLAQFEDNRRQALQQARSSGASDDWRLLEQALAGDELPFKAADLRGRWACRSFKLGGTLALAVYRPFQCEIVADGQGYRLAKINGSQRTAGRLVIQDERHAIYWGVLTVTGQKAVPYGRDAQRDQVARVVRTKPDHLRLEFPRPTYEADFEILDLTRETAP